MRSRLFTIASVVSLLLSAATFWVLIQSIDDDLTWGFVRHSVRWEIACRAGKLGIDNDPEIWEARRPEREEAAVQEAVNKEPWGSAGYYKALEQLNALQKARQGKPGPAPAVIARVEYAVRLELLIVAGMILPVLWASRRVARVRRRPVGPIGRGIFTTAAALSLLLGAATVVFWVRSYGRVEDVNRNSIDRDGVHRLVTIWSWHGSMYVWHNLGSSSPAIKPRATTWFVHSKLSQRATFATTFAVLPTYDAGDQTAHYSAQWQYGFGGVTIGGRRTVTTSNIPGKLDTATYRFSGAIVPYWLVILLLLASPTLWGVTRLRRALRHAPGHCRKCGYDLTANTSGTCPECGTAVASPVA